MKLAFHLKGSVDGGKSYFGTPIEESREKLKQLLPNIKKKIPEILGN
jgi:UDP-3-O-[3-hydroxymyristoyl] glucosamine N-acyltransferase